MKKLLYGATYEDLLSAQKYARAWAPIFGKLFLAIVYLKKNIQSDVLRAWANFKAFLSLKSSA